MLVLLCMFICQPPTEARDHIRIMDKTAWAKASVRIARVVHGFVSDFEV